VVTTSPLAPTSPAGHHSGAVQHDIRLGLLALLLLAIAATAVVWPVGAEGAPRDLAHQPVDVLELTDPADRAQSPERDVRERLAHRLAT
jgi:hypothetical protein